MTRRSDYEEFESSSAANRRLLRQEELILEVTEALAEALQREGIKRTQLAARIGRSKAFVSQILAGKRNLTLRTIADVADALRCRIKVRMHREPETLPLVGRQTVRFVRASGAERRVVSDAPKAGVRHRGKGGRRMRAEVEYERPHTSIEELDLERAIADVRALPNKLVETRLLDFPAAVGGGVGSMCVSRRGSVQPHLEPNGASVFGRSEDKVQVPAVEPERDSPARFLEQCVLGPDVPSPDQPPAIQREPG